MPIKLTVRFCALSALTFMQVLTLTFAQDDPVSSVMENCDFLQPTSYVPNYIRTSTSQRSVPIYPRPNSHCQERASISPGSTIKVHSESGDWRFIENLSAKGWGWINKNGISNCGFLQPTNYVPNYIRVTTSQSSVSIYPRPNRDCAERGSITTGSSIRIRVTFYNPVVTLQTIFAAPPAITLQQSIHARTAIALNAAR